jgi:hypothetical protein
MKWTDELIKTELLKSINVLGLDRMPTAEELKGINRNDLHCKISRTKKYSGWAEELNLSLKSCTTRAGQKYEGVLLEVLKNQGYKVEAMTTKHPYDLLVNSAIKIDVKVAKPYLLRGKDRVHTFNLSKIKPTCDIYILIALDENENIERLFVIPSHFVQQPMVNMGKESKYNFYVNSWHYLTAFDEFYKKLG